MHTYSLLTAHADRSTIDAHGLTLLDAFLERQREYQTTLLVDIAEDATLTARESAWDTIEEHFRLLQACDNLSLLTCVAFNGQANLLHPLPLNDGGTAEVQVEPQAPRRFRLSPWPFAEPELTFHFPARHVQGEIFETSAALEQAFHAAIVEELTVVLSS
jgi:hypothetical protein